MPTIFESLKLTDTGCFGLRIAGSVGRHDRERLELLGEKCLARGRHRLVLDFSDLDALGGSAAGTLAKLQRRFMEAGGKIVFVGASAGARRFLSAKFEDLPLDCYDSLDEAMQHLSDPGAGPMSSSSPEMSAAPVSPGRETGARARGRGEGSGDGTLDNLLEEFDSEAAGSPEETRRTADLVTAAYLPLDDAVAALASLDNPAAFGEALTNLLLSHDLASQSLYLSLHGEHFVAVDGSCKLPVGGAVAAALMYAQRPLTLLDIEENALWDEETELIDELQPDLLLPIKWKGTLHGLALLKHMGEDRDYALAEVFALEILLRLLAVGRGDTAAARPAPSPRAYEDETRVDEPDPLQQLRFGLARDLADAQDEPHFWQIFHGRLHEVAEIHSLVCLDLEQTKSEPFLAGAARAGMAGIDLQSERVLAFFRTLERPVEIPNMPHSFATVRDGLAELELQWVMGMNVDRRCLGAVMVGLTWRNPVIDPLEQLHGVMDVATEALVRLRDAQLRANLNLGLVELLVGRGEALSVGDGHLTEIVAANIRTLAREMGLPPDQERDLVLGALLRNIGQSEAPVVDDREAETLEGDAWEAYRHHPEAGANILQSLRAPATIRDAVLHHHERYDGRGFPHGLKGRDIPLAARMVAVVQAYAMRYSGSAAREQALMALSHEAGKALDPDLVDLFARAVHRDPSVREPEPAMA